MTYTSDERAQIAKATRTQMPDERHPTYPYTERWDHCLHEWRDYEGMSDREVVCRKCGVHGDKHPITGDVFWPAT
jgi:hypothetical protein